MSLAELTRQSIEQALAEAESLGRERFLARIMHRMLADVAQAYDRRRIRLLAFFDACDQLKGYTMRSSPLLLALVASLFSQHALSKGLDDSCRALTASYRSFGIYDAIIDANTSDVPPAPFYDAVACECRLNLRQSISEAASKAIAAANAGLNPEIPAGHNLTPKQEKEASAFANWIEGHGNRPTMAGVLACTYSRGTAN